MSALVGDLEDAETVDRLLEALGGGPADVVLSDAAPKLTGVRETDRANEERLLKVRANLENTLSICKRAKGTLEKGIGHPARRRLEAAQGSERTSAGKMSYRDYVELSSIDEYQRFKSLPPISADDLDSADIEDLMRQLGDL